MANWVDRLQAKGRWIASAILVWAALAQIAPGIFQLRPEHMMWQFLVGPTVGWILLALVGIYIVFRLDSIADVDRPRRLIAAVPLVILSTRGINIYRVSGGASVHLHLNIVSFLPFDSHLDNLTVRLDSTVENCVADPQNIPGLQVTDITAKASLTEEQARAIREAGSITVNGSVTSSSRGSAKTTIGFTIGRVPIGVEKGSGAFFRLEKLTNHRPSARAAAGGMRHGEA